MKEEEEEERKEEEETGTDVRRQLVGSHLSQVCPSTGCDLGVVKSVYRCLAC